MAQIRLDKYLADCGNSTRSECKTTIKKGSVSVNGKVIKDGSLKINPDCDCVYVNGRKLSYSKYTYIMLNKPSGVITATKDLNDKTVLELLPAELAKRYIFPVGRLDKDTTGLLILTNNGDFAHKTLSPKKHISKTYIAKVTGKVDDEAINAFKRGIQLNDHHCKEAELEIISENDEYTLTKVVISEGIFHQIKRMFKAINCTVIELKRIAFGDIILDNQLAEGECRPLNEEELQYVNKIIGG